MATMIFMGSSFASQKKESDYKPFRKNEKEKSLKTGKNSSYSKHNPNEPVHYLIDKRANYLRPDRG